MALFPGLPHSLQLGAHVALQIHIENKYCSKGSFLRWNMHSMNCRVHSAGRNEPHLLRKNAASYQSVSQSGHGIHQTGQPLMLSGSAHLFGSPALSMAKQKERLLQSYTLRANLSGGGDTSCSGKAVVPLPSSKIPKLCAMLASIFPLWVVLATFSAMAKPQLFTWIKGDVMVSALALTMLGMGTTLSLDDLKGAFAMPKQLLAGVVLQYTVMPTLGALVASLMNLPEYYSVGIILVACCPGGTASNIVTYLARGNVALSVLMTAVSTVLAVVMTPTLTSLLAGKFVPVNGAALFGSTLQVVLLPVLAGALANHYLPTLVRQVSDFAPLVAVLTVAAVVGSAVATSSHALQVAGVERLLLSVVLLHGGGFLGGYLLARLLRFDLPTSRTVAIEVGMQNSVLGVLLASQHFPNPLTAAPCALSSVTHSVLGSLLAACWRLQSSANESTSKSKATESSAQNVTPPQ